MTRIFLAMKKDWETNIAKNSKFNKILGLEREKARKGLENLADFAFYYSCYFGTFFMVGSWPWKVLLAFTFVSSICARLWALGFDTSISIGREETLTRGCLGPFLPFFLMRNSWLFFVLLRNPRPSFPLFFTSLNFCKLEQFWLLLLLIFAKFADR